MAKSGVLSDYATKMRYPEFFPLDIGGQEKMAKVHLKKNIYKGIKVPTETKVLHKPSRFPINDLRNFATVAQPSRSTELAFQAIQNYRKELGSNNFQPNIQTSFQNRLSGGDLILPVAPSSQAGGVQAPASLSLGRIARKEASDLFSKNLAGSRSFLSARMRSTIANLVDIEEYRDIAGYLLNGEYPKPVSDGEALSKLNRMYRSDTASLALIERSYDQSGRAELPPLEVSADGAEELMNEAPEDVYGEDSMRDPTFNFE